MRFLFLSIFLFSTLIGFSQQTVKADKLIEKDSITYYNGVAFTGKAQIRFDNNQLQVESNYVDGKKNGLETTYNIKGLTTNKTMFKNGIPHGECKQWYENGNLEYEVNYDKFYLNGHCVRYYENGYVQSEGAYMHCKEQGYWIYRYENGNKEKDGMYDKGLPIELWTYYNEYGEKVKTIFYDNHGNALKETILTK